MRADALYLEILASYYSVPPALEAIATGCRRLADGTKITLWRTGQHDEDYTPISTEEEADLMRLYGATNAYDWCCTFWGSKWGDCHTELCAGIVDAEPADSLVYVFEGAWSCPCRGFCEVSKRFPSLTFSIEYREPMAGFIGSYVCQNGKALNDSVFDMYDYDGDH